MTLTRRMVRMSMLAAALLACMGQAAAQDSPRLALEEFRRAATTGDVKLLAARTADILDDQGKVVEPLGTAFRDIAEPYLALREASERLDAVLRLQADPKSPEKAGNFRNPFSGSFNAFQDLTCEIVEEPEPIESKIKGRMIARIKYGPRGQAPEEAVYVQLEDKTWRVSPPVSLAASIRRLAQQEIRSKRVQGYKALAGLLDEIAAMLSKGEFKTKDEVTLYLVRRFKEKNLGTLLQ